MNIHKARSRCNIKPHLHVRKYEVYIVQASLTMTFYNFFVGVSDVVIRHGDRFNRWRQSFEGTEVVIPRVRSDKLVVQHRARSVDVRLPATPLRTSCNHCFPIASQVIFAHASVPVLRSRIKDRIAWSLFEISAHTGVSRTDGAQISLLSSP